MQYNSKIITDILEEAIMCISKNSSNLVPDLLNKNHRLIYKLINTPLIKYNNNTLLMCCLDTLKDCTNKLEQNNLIKVINLIIQDPRLDLNLVNNDENTIFHMAFNYGIITDYDLSKNFCNIGENLLNLLKNQDILQTTFEKQNKIGKTFFNYISSNNVLKSVESAEKQAIIINNCRYITRRITPIIQTIVNFSFKNAIQEYFKSYLNETLRKNSNHKSSPVMISFIKLYNNSNEQHHQQLSLLEQLALYIKEHSTIIKNILKTTSDDTEIIRSIYLMIKKFDGYLNCLDK